MLLLLTFGFLLGVRHALEADHLATIAMLSTRVRSTRGAARLGGLWGIGHAAALVVFGTTLIALGAAVPPQVAHGLESAVGIALVILGLDILRRLRKGRIHVHAHEHEDGVRHVHVHAHPYRTEHEHDSHRHEHPRGVAARALALGGLHGLAGTAALVLLSLQMVPSRAQAFAYLLVFALGSVAGMALFSAVITLPLRAGGRRLERAHRALEGAYGVFAIALGLWIVLG